MNKKLYKRDKNGKIRYWRIKVENRDEVVSIVVKSGEIDGKEVVRTTFITSGKNIGKSNQTDPYSQAIKQATSKYQKKLDEGYFKSIKEAKTGLLYLPMLAHKYTERKHKIDFSCAYIQPKLDGVRCIVKKEKSGLIFISRGGKPYTALQRHNDLVNELNSIMKIGDIFDGEIYYHGWPLQGIVSAVKKFGPDTSNLNFYLFDCIIDKPYKDRLAFISKFENSTHVKILTAILVGNDFFVKYFHDKFIQEGYEGAIIRNGSGLYALNQRSVDLQKYKEFNEDEFEIVDVYCETNIINNVKIDSICFRCVTKEGEIFDVRPKGTLEYRGEMLKNKNSYIGKYLTVRYQTFTDSNQGKGRMVPQFPIGIVIREY